MYLNFESEKQMEDAVIEYLEDRIDFLDNGGDWKELDEFSGEVLTYGNPTLMRQVYLGDYGTADIIVVSKENDSEAIYVHVLELKNREFKMKDLEQLSRYMVGIEEIIKLLKPKSKVKIEGSVICTFSDNFFYNYFLKENISYWTLSFDTINGMVFDPEHIVRYVKSEDPKVNDLEFCMVIKELDEKKVTHG